MRTLTIIGIIVALLGITITAIPFFGNPNLDIPFIHIPFLEGESERPKIKVEKKPKTQIPHQITARRQKENLTLPMVMEYLKEFYTPSNKLEFIETRIDSMPESLSWAELNDILDLFYTYSYKLKVAKLLRSRIKTTASDQDRRRFMNHFYTSTSKKEAIKLLLGK